MKGKNWTITKNIIDNVPALTAPEDQTLKFRLRDDDGNIYFIGMMVEDFSEAIFDPLDGFGAGYGCTDIQIVEKGRWVSV